jgi:hypothetical protein
MQYKNKTCTIRDDDNDTMKRTALALGIGFVLGCHLGTYFLSGVVLIVMIGIVLYTAAAR